MPMIRRLAWKLSQLSSHVGNTRLAAQLAGSCDLGLWPLSAWPPAGQPTVRVTGTEPFRARKAKLGATTARSDDSPLVRFSKAHDTCTQDMHEMVWRCSCMDFNASDGAPIAAERSHFIRSRTSSAAGEGVRSSGIASRQAASLHGATSIRCSPDIFRARTLRQSGYR